MKVNGSLAQWIAITITAASTLAAVAWSYGQNSQRISTIEKRQDEDRRDTKEAVQETKRDVKQVVQDVQTILRKIESMEAVQKAERRGQR